MQFHFEQLPVDNQLQQVFHFPADVVQQFL